MRPSTPKASAVSLPPPLLRLLPSATNQFPGGFTPAVDQRLFTAHSDKCVNQNTDSFRVRESAEHVNPVRNRRSSFQYPWTDEFCEPQSITGILGAGPFRPNDARFTNELLLGSQQVHIQDSVNSKKRRAGTNKPHGTYILGSSGKAERVA